MLSFSMLLHRLLLQLTVLLLLSGRSYSTFQTTTRITAIPTTSLSFISIGQNNDNYITQKQKQLLQHQQQQIITWNAYYIMQTTTTTTTTRRRRKTIAIASNDKSTEISVPVSLNVDTNNDTIPTTSTGSTFSVPEAGDTLESQSDTSTSTSPTTTSTMKYTKHLYLNDVHIAINDFGYDINEWENCVNYVASILQATDINDLHDIIVSSTSASSSNKDTNTIITSTSTSTSNDNNDVTTTEDIENLVSIAYGWQRYVLVTGVRARKYITKPIMPSITEIQQSILYLVNDIQLNIQTIQLGIQQHPSIYLLKSNEYYTKLVNVIPSFDNSKNDNDEIDVGRPVITSSTDTERIKQLIQRDTSVLNLITNCISAGTGTCQSNCNQCWVTYTNQEKNKEILL